MFILLGCDVTSLDNLCLTFRDYNIVKKGRVPNAQKNGNFKVQVLESNVKLENVFLIHNLK
jgi:hypothetical protein